MQEHHCEPVVSNRVRVCRSFPQFGHLIACGVRLEKTRGTRLYFFSFSARRNSANFSCLVSIVCPSCEGISAARLFYSMELNAVGLLFSVNVVVIICGSCLVWLSMGAA